MNKKEKNNWLAEGLRLLEKEDFSKITINNLCNMLNKTKGAFYHHFQNIDDYVHCLMEYWLQENTLSFIEKAEKESKVEAKEHTLNMLVVKAKHKAEQNIRGWSFANRMVKEYVKKVDDIRVQYVTDINIAKGIEPVTARQISMLVYAILVGLQQVYPGLSQEEYNELLDTYYKTQNNLHIDSREIKYI